MHLQNTFYVNCEKSKLVKFKSLNMQFPDISIYEKNSIIAEFFFSKCIVPILTNPENYVIVTSTVISMTTRKNFANIAKVSIR